jgi:Membrane bound O-acyl transferase family
MAFPDLRLTLGWLTYGIVSSAALYFAKMRFQAGKVLAVALLFSVIDAYIPFSYPFPERVLEVSSIQFFFVLLRPGKMVLFAFDKGPLAHQMSLKQHILLTLLPVMPIRALTEKMQKRIPAFKPSVGVFLESVAWLVALIMLGACTCAYATSETSFAFRSVKHILAFVAFIHHLLLTSALLASVLGTEPVVRPFNYFWRSKSLADFWSYRWNTVIGSTLRMTVYEPIIEHYQATHPDKPIPKHARVLAAFGTFAYSAMIHEHALVNQRAFTAVGPLTIFFLAQPVLMAFQWWLTRHGTKLLHDAVQMHTSSRRSEETIQNGVGKFTTYVLGFASLLLWWCPVYDPPYSHLSEVAAQGLVQLVPTLPERLPPCIR